MTTFERNPVTWICCTSVDDARTTINNADDIVLLRECIRYEMKHGNRSSMIKMLLARIRKLEKNAL